MNQKHLNKLTTILFFVILILAVVVIYLSRKQDLNYKTKMKNLIESNTKAQSQIDSALAIIVRSNLEKIEFNNRIDSLNETATSLKQSVSELKKELKYIKGTYKGLSSDSIFSIAKSRYEKNNPRTPIL
jgi:uncharacterized protein HemX